MGRELNGCCAFCWRSFFFFAFLFAKEGTNIYLCGERVKMHATYIMTKGHTTYLIKPRACCGLVSVAGSFFCHTK